MHDADGAAATELMNGSGDELVTHAALAQEEHGVRFACVVCGQRAHSPHGWTLPDDPAERGPPLAKARGCRLRAGARESIDEGCKRKPPVRRQGGDGRQDDSSHPLVWRSVAAWPDQGLEDLRNEFLGAGPTGQGQKRLGGVEGARRSPGSFGIAKRGVHAHAPSSSSRSAAS